jgi:hypothetical protein
MHEGLFWEIPAYAAAASAERRATSSEHQALRAQQEVRRLENRLEKLTMVAAGMWALLKRRNPDLCDDDLATVVQDIDLTDGRLDGRVRHDARPCPACARPMATRHEECIYCGEKVPLPGPLPGLR